MYVPIKSPDAARKLGISYWRLSSLLRGGHINPPIKDSSNHYHWSPQDLEQARKVIDHMEHRGKSRPLDTAT